MAKKDHMFDLQIMKPLTLEIKKELYTIIADHSHCLDADRWWKVTLLSIAIVVDGRNSDRDISVDRLDEEPG